VESMVISRRITASASYTKKNDVSLVAQLEDV
jgi:hypothetical protein